MTRNRFCFSNCWIVVYSKISLKMRRGIRGWLTLQAIVYFLCLMTFRRTAIENKSETLYYCLRVQFFWDYSRMRMHGMRIADYLEYYQAKEWVIRKQFHSWEELAWELIRGSEKSQKSIAGSCVLRKEHFFFYLFRSSE